MARINAALPKINECNDKQMLQAEAAAFIGISHITLRNWLAVLGLKWNNLKPRK